MLVKVEGRTLIKDEHDPRDILHKHTPLNYMSLKGSCYVQNFFKI